MSVILKQIAQNVSQKEVIINGTNRALSSAAFLSQRDEESGLSYRYYGGTYAKADGSLLTIADGSVALVANTTNYVQLNITTGSLVVNQTGFLTGNIRIARCVTNASNITNTSTDEKIQILWPEGALTTLAGGGGSSVLPSVFDYKQLTDLTFQISGGEWPNPGYALYESRIPLSNYVNTSDLSLTANNSYRVFFDYSLNSVKTLLLDSTSVGPSTTNGKLLYIIKTDATKISSIIDYRAYDILINNDVFINVIPTLTSGTRFYDFSFTQLQNLDQTAKQSSVNGTISIFPQMSRPNFCLLCKSSDKGYNAYDEAEFGTGASRTKPYRFNRTLQTYKVFVEDDIYVFNQSTNLWEVIDYTKWSLVLKLELNFH